MTKDFRRAKSPGPLMEIKTTSQKLNRRPSRLEMTYEDKQGIEEFMKEV